MAGRNQQVSSPRRGRAWFNLRFQLVALLLLCYLIPVLLLGSFTRNVILGSMREKVESALVSGARHAWAMMEQNLDRVVALGQETVYDEELSTVWTRWNASRVSNAEFLQTCRNYLERKFGRDRLFTFAAFLPAGEHDFFISNPSGQLAAAAFFREAPEPMLAPADSALPAAYFTGTGEAPVLIRNVLNLRMENTGVLVLGLNFREFLSSLLDLRESWNADLCLRLGQWDYGNPPPDWEALPPGFADLPDEKRLRYVQQEENDDYSLSLMVTLDREEQYRDLYMLQRLNLLLSLLLLPLLALIMLYVHRRITRPIGLLADASRRIEAGELGVTVSMHGGDELGDLGVAFSNMSLRLKELIEQTYQAEIELKNAQIQALQSRINPHFLNNALESINWEARIEGSETISAMIGALSSVLNATLARKNRRLVSLREELEVSDGYIYFIQLRFGEALTLSRRIDPEAEKSIVPLLTVQPILENAVEHGIAPAGGGEIRMTVEKEENCLRLLIVNTGRCILPEDRARIDAALSGETGESGHLGLANISNRLRLLYGAAGLIKVSGGPGQETAVEIRIPQKELMEQEEPADAKRA